MQSRDLLGVQQQAAQWALDTTCSYPWAAPRLAPPLPARPSVQRWEEGREDGEQESRHCCGSSIPGVLCLTPAGTAEGSEGPRQAETGRGGSTPNRPSSCGVITHRAAAHGR